MTQKKKIRHRLPDKSFSVPTCYDCEVPLENIGDVHGKTGWKCPKCRVTYFCPVCASCGKLIQPWERTGIERNIIVGREVCMTCWNDKDTHWDDGKCPKCGFDLWGKEGMEIRKSRSSSRRPTE